MLLSLKIPTPSKLATLLLNELNWSMGASVFKSVESREGIFDVSRLEVLLRLLRFGRRLLSGKKRF